MPLAPGAHNLQSDIAKWYLHSQGSREGFVRQDSGGNALSHGAPAGRRSGRGATSGRFSETFLVCLDRLSQAHEQELSLLQTENSTLHSEVSRLKGRISELVLALQRTQGGRGRRAEGTAAETVATLMGKATGRAPLPEEQLVLTRATSEEWYAGQRPVAPVPSGNMPSRKRPALHQVPEVRNKAEHSDSETATDCESSLSHRTGDSLLSRWARLVQGTLELAARELFQLQDVWRKDQHFISRVERAWNSEAMDLFVRDAREKHRPRQSLDSKQGYLFRGMSQQGFFTSGGLLGAGPSSSHNSRKRGCKQRTKDVLSKCTMDPQSPRRITWGLVGLALVIYDLLYLPLTLFELPKHWFPEFMDIASQAYWTMDLGVSFLTGVYIDSELHTDLKTIAFCYMKSLWFPVDLGITMPLWIPVVMGGDDFESSKSLRSFRFVRIIRFLRLLRLIKLTHLLSESLNLINSPAVLITIGIMKLMIGLMLTNHVIACVWYWVGDDAQNDGWVADHMLDGRMILYQYLTAMHWTVTQFQGTSDILPGTSLLERLYAVSMVMFALIAFSCFVSLLTNLIMELHGLHAHRTFEQRVVRGYLSNHNISAQLSIRVKKYVEWRQRVDKVREHDAAVMQLLPEQIMGDLLEEVRIPVITQHRFFMMLRLAYPRVVRRISAEVLQDIAPAPDELVFTPYDAKPRMYWVARGKLLYSWNSTADIHRSRSFKSWSLSSRKSFCEEEAQVSGGQHLAEQVLWTQWEHCGKLVGLGDASLLALDSKDFVGVIESYTAAHCSAVYYARRFIAALNRFGKRYTDLIAADFFDDMAKEVAGEDFEDSE